MVIRKPAGLAVQSARIGQPDVVSELQSHLAKLPDTGRLGPGKGEPYLGIVHRLDQPVEGVLVFAKEKKAAAALTKQLSDGTLNKHYYAVLCGCLLYTSKADLPRRLPKARNPKEQKKVDTDAGRKGSPVILAEKPMPILFMERAQPSASICDRDNSRCPANFFFFWHRLLSGEKLRHHLESSHFPT